MLFKNLFASINQADINSIHAPGNSAGLWGNFGVAAHKTHTGLKRLFPMHITKDPLGPLTF